MAVAGAFLLLVAIGAFSTESKSSIAERNTAAWEKNLREANGPNWEPTKTELETLRSTARATAQKMGPPPAATDL